MPTGHFKRADTGTTLYYETHGSGTPLILVAGVGSDLMSWLGVMRALATDYRVIVFDNRGCGRSSNPDAPFSIRQMADDVVRLLGHLRIRRCHLVGHSMGGYIGQEVAMRHPGLIDRLVLEASAPVASARTNALLKNLLKRREETDDLAAWITEWTFWLFSPRTFERASFIKTFIRNAAAHPYPQPVSGLKRQISAIASFDARTRIRKITAKTLVLTGEDDILITPHESAALTNAIPGSIAASLPGTGHCIHFEDPALFIDIVKKFLAQDMHR